jgi:DNA replication factor GINS
MYNELYTSWKKEIEEPSLGSLPPDFYARMADYLKHVAAENKPLDNKSVRISLLEHEAQNVRQMLEELIWARYHKLIKTITQSQKLPSEQLTVEEAKMCEIFVSFTDAYQKFAKNILQGQSEQADAQIGHKRLVLRFSKDIPAIIGVDMKTYGPFKIEDVASLPVENAKILIKQGLAVLVEVS